MNRNLKRSILIAFDTLVLFVAHAISYVFFDPLVSLTQSTFFIHLLFVIIFYIILGETIKIFDKVNRFTSVRETLIHVALVSISYLGGSVLYNILGEGLSFRHVAFAFLISVIAIPASRVAWRLYIEHQLKLENNTNHAVDEQPTRTLIIGAGEAGAIFVRSIRMRSDIDVIGFLDDDKNKQGTTVYGHPVIGTVKDIEETVERYGVEQITIAIPSLSGDEMQEILAEARKINVKTNQMPFVEDVLSGDYQPDEFKEIEVADLLGRDEVDLDMEVIRDQVAGKTVLVSGAGGSIGSEISRQIASFNPKRLILLGHGEFSIYKIDRELRKWPNRTFEVEPVIADIQDRERIFDVMQRHQPDLVYHAAAHKHVPMMEANPREAVKNNVYGTKNLAEAAKNADVKSFVMVSTDKAVNPPNVMGATKRIAEMIVTGLNEESHTRFEAVRFGNVLNSSGSVVPVFREQIANGGPVTVTDFRMTRYFMTIPEASRLVLQAGALADGGEIFVLDMGAPVRIVDLAKQMVWLSGHNETEIEIVESGIRPGEKLYEELLATDENTGEQVFEKIFVGKVHNLPLKQVFAFIESLKKLTDSELKEALVKFANNSYEENSIEIEKLNNGKLNNTLLNNLELQGE